MKPLFIPLRGQYYDSFEDGTKTDEFRLYGPRWNERTCHLGRKVTLSRGYGKKNRLYGVVAGFRASSEPVDLTPAFRDCYPNAKNSQVAVISIKLNHIFVPCPGGCSHNQEEHEAFDDGLNAGESKPDAENPFSHDDQNGLWFAWGSGHSVGMTNRLKETETRSLI